MSTFFVYNVMATCEYYEDIIGLVILNIIFLNSTNIFSNRLFDVKTPKSIA